ncbi:GAF and ANTAR domain-containing protein [Rhodococcus sp. UNC23MFCrub1.1]|uniref:GAF and ANTAR domain-containing protein n=1 Tax=Rhodococcus sp. UNC23MFCrub1.1 TaxID=1449068 RepID=UPI000AEAEC1F|nr:GAF and ANTAR domain-containing protein [Rhodococcus sp. UNC23MFCrub1.1]
MGVESGEHMTVPYGDRGDLVRTIDEDTSVDQQASALGRIAEMARTLRGTRRSVDDTLTALVRSATQLMPGVDHACVTVMTGARRTIHARTDDVAADLCRVQFELGEGPTENEIWQIDTVVAENLGSERRWPSFAAAARDRGIESMAAFRLYTDPSARDLGVLLLFSRTADAFDADAQMVGSALAAHGAVALLSARDDQNFRDGLASRDIIGQAKGILMERFDVDAVQAFTMLAHISQSENRPLREVALSLIEESHPTRSVEVPPVA